MLRTIGGSVNSEVLMLDGSRDGTLCEGEVGRCATIVRRSTCQHVAVLVNRERPGDGSHSRCKLGRDLDVLLAVAGFCPEIISLGRMQHPVLVCCFGKAVRHRVDAHDEVVVAMLGTMRNQRRQARGNAAA